jgi:nucleoside-diphosphate-sugar epimerase
MTRVLITGVSGFIGTNLVRSLTARPDTKIFGHSRNPVAGRKAAGLDAVTWIGGLTAKEFDAHGIDVIIHLAGIAHDLSGHYHREDYDNVNFKATAALYDEFQQSSARRFFYVSSIKAVADRSATPLREDIVPAPQSDYGKSKLAAEKYILSRNTTGEKRYYIFRPCMIHGQGNKGNLNLLYQLIMKGIPYPLGAFENRRSFLSIDNFAFVIERFIDGNVVSGVFNIADSEAISTNELIRVMASASNRKARILHLPRSLMKFAASIGTALRLPFNSARLGKLTEDMVLSNSKLLETMGCDLPVSVRDGLQQTVKTFS